MRGLIAGTLLLVGLALPGPSSALPVLAQPAAPSALPGTWTTGAYASGLSLLLTDGSVLQQPSFSSAQWQRILPGPGGHYDWSHPVAAATMHDTRGFFPSVVMRDGRVFVAGGEYGTGSHTAEIYDPVANAWTSVPNTPGANFSDCSALCLSDGRVLTLTNGPVHGFIYAPQTGVWSQTSDNTFPFNESSVVQLPGSVFFLVSPTSYPATAKYLPGTDQWVPAAPAPTGADAIDSGGEGTKVLLYDGRVLGLGTTGKVGYYSPGAHAADPGTWTTGPLLPDNSKRQDAFAVVMANGHVFLSADQGGHNGPTRFYDFDPSTETFVDVSPVAGGYGGPSDPYMSLLLPTGEVFVSGIGIYTPVVGGPENSWRPVVSSIADLGGGTWRLTGLQLSGLTEGAYYGDDAQMSTNYPLVRLTSSGGTITYARSFNFSTMAVSTGSAPVTADFTLPALPDGDYQLEVVTNAVPSQATAVRIQGGALVVGGGVPPPAGGGSSGGGGGGGGGGGCGATGLEGGLVFGLLGFFGRKFRRSAR